ncbi:MAG: RND family efflux transporter MFP subunit [Candidatus Azotimanducaceae bacterium]|jgi:RND family efflux transporter MFP subunit
MFNRTLNRTFNRAKILLSSKVLIQIFIFASLVGCNQAEEPRSRVKAPVRVVVEPLQYSNQQLIAEAVGTARALRSVTLYPVASGEVVAVDFEPGQFVEAGHVLVQLDQRKEKLGLELAEFRLSEADSLYTRYKVSAATGATPPMTLEAAATALEAARIALGQAQIALQDRRIIAPFSGHVGMTDLDAGGRVQPDTEVTTLDSRSSLLVSFELPEVLLGQISMGDMISLQTWEPNAAEFGGEIIDIGSRVDPELRTFITRAKVDNPQDGFRPGMSFRVRMELQGERYPILPEIALQWGADGAFVWIVEEGIARRIPVDVIQRNKGKVLVDGGIDKESIIIVEGLQRLRPGIVVQPNSTIAGETTLKSQLPIKES